MPVQMPAFPAASYLRAPRMMPSGAGLSLRTPGVDSVHFERAAAPSAPPSLQFGFCPLCIALAGAGLAAAGKGIKFLRDRAAENKDPYNLVAVFGPELAEKLLKVLEQIETVQPQILETFKQSARAFVKKEENPEIPFDTASKALMAAITQVDVNLAEQAQAILAQKRRPN